MSDCTSVRTIKQKIAKVLTKLYRVSQEENKTFAPTPNEIREELKEYDCVYTADEWKNIVKPVLKEVFSKFNTPGWAEYKATFSKLKKPVIPIEEPKIESPGLPRELTSLSSDQLRILAKVCKTKTLPELRDKLKFYKISNIGGKSISSIPKKTICPIFEPYFSPSPKASAAISPIERPVSPGFDIKTCNTKAQTIATLKKYISKQGWSLPSKITKKADICQFIADKIKVPVSKVEQAVQETETAPSFPGVAACVKDRVNYTIDKIKKIAAERGWTSDPSYPKSNAPKQTWCKWLEKMESSSPAIVHPASLSTPPPSPISKCIKYDEGSSLQEYEDRTVCPADNVCDIDSGVCVSDLDIISTDIPIGNNKIIKVHGTPANLATLKKKIEELVNVEKLPNLPPTAKSCGTLTRGTPEELLNDLTCGGDLVCDLSSKSCVPVASLGPGLSKFVYKGREIIGPTQSIDELREKLMEEPTQPVSPLVEIPKAEEIQLVGCSVLFKDGEKINLDDIQASDLYTIRHDTPKFHDVKNMTCTLFYPKNPPKIGEEIKNDEFPIQEGQWIVKTTRGTTIVAENKDVDLGLLSSLLNIELPSESSTAQQEKPKTALPKPKTIQTGRLTRSREEEEEISHALDQIARMESGQEPLITAPTGFKTTSEPLSDIEKLKTKLQNISMEPLTVPVRLASQEIDIQKKLNLCAGISS